MLSWRNLHFAILGIILGATSGYILAFYQAQNTMARQTTPVPDSKMPPNHPDVSNEEVLTLFKQAMEKNPNDPELLTRYAGFLLSLNRYSEAAEWFQKVLVIKPNDVPTLHGLFLTQVNGEPDFTAAANTLKQMEKIDPKYEYLPALKKQLEENAKAAK